MTKRKQPREFNEKNILREMSEALGEDHEALSIDESSVASFGEEAYTVKAGRQEWTVVENDDVAERLALAVVTQDLEQEPEIFNRSFIESHIDMERLKEWVRDAVMEDEYSSEIARSEPERFWEEAAHWGIDVPEPDEDGNMPDDVDDKYVEALQEMIADDRAKDPMAFFEDLYGRDEAQKYAMEAVGIDIGEAAQDAVDTDGWQHFLSRYDGSSDETESGFVYWRES
jgi:hypothetical protein